jgi:hypothetical protein
MIQTAEQIYETIKVLPDTERDKLERLMKNGRSNGVRATSYRSERFEKAMRWVQENRDRYVGQFVLLEGDELIGHGTDPKELYKLADQRGIKTPFVKRIIASEEPFFGGW